MYLKETLLVAVFSIGVTAVIGECDIGWAEFKEDCLWFSSSSATWDKAEAHCRGMGAYLATDDNEDKHDFLATILNVLRDYHAYVWFIGGTDYTFEGQYRWLETGLHVGPFTRWAPGQPNGTMGENCIGLRWDGRDLMWTDEPCQPIHLPHGHHGHTVPVGNYNFICEKHNNQTTSAVIG
ncbi:perlucin-like [Pecten maximus]|uniref:perlucin-like n=1 Tax=Pecten maximus TaxID=6579 RepID=UPI00145820EA|nr:perlucin-like [Pecten maximus]